MLKLKVKVVKTGAKIPVVAHRGEDLGYDVFSAEDDVVVLAPGEQKALRTGIAVEMGEWQVPSFNPFTVNLLATSPMLGFNHFNVKAGLIAKQPSGLALKRMVDVKAGVIDAGYRNEIKILLFNYGKETQVFSPGDKIGQLVPIPVFAGDVEQIEELTDSKRGLAGWGSGQTEATKPIPDGLTAKVTPETLTPPEDVEVKSKKTVKLSVKEGIVNE
jgi:dUTP pyrophosphatase